MKNSRLELIRGGAAILVFICHLIVTKPALHNIDSGLISHWGTESVMLFFILSGVVISMTHDKSADQPRTFLAKRALRIYPLFIVSLMMAYLLVAVLRNQRVTIWDTVGNLLMFATLDGKLFPVPLTNISVWSLSYEMFFYLLFAFLVVQDGYRWIWAWSGLAMVAVPLHYENYPGISGYIVDHLAFSIPWLIGVLTFRYRARAPQLSLREMMFYAALLPAIARWKLSSDPYCIVKYVIFSLGAIPVFLYALQPPKDEAVVSGRRQLFATAWYLIVAGILVIWSDARPIAKGLYILLPGCAWLSGRIIGDVGRRLLAATLATGAAVGSISYGLYIIHYPVIIIIDRVISNQWMYMIIATLATVTVAYLLEKRFQVYVYKLVRRR